LASHGQAREEIGQENRHLLEDATGTPRPFAYDPGNPRTGLLTNPRLLVDNTTDGLRKHMSKLGDIVYHPMAPVVYRVSSSYFAPASKFPLAALGSRLRQR